MLKRDSKFLRVNYWKIITSWNFSFPGYFWNTSVIFYQCFFNLHDCTIKIGDYWMNILYIPTYSSWIFQRASLCLENCMLTRTDAYIIAQLNKIHLCFSLTKKWMSCYFNIIMWVFILDGNIGFGMLNL